MNELSFTIVITAYNNGPYAHECLTSALGQEYPACAIVYVDDCSTDNGPDIVNGLLRTHPQAVKVRYQRTPMRRKKLANLYQAIHSLSPETIVVELDGDDALAHANTLTTLAACYRHTNAWFVYANYRNEPTTLATQLHLEHFNAPTPWLIQKLRLFRKYPWIYSGLRSYYAGLFQQIKKRDLMHPHDNSQCIPICHDLAYTYPMLEMAGNHIAHIDEPLLIRHIDSPINDFKNPDTSLAAAMRSHIKNQKRYARLGRVF